MNLHILQGSNEMTNRLIHGTTAFAIAMVIAGLSGADSANAQPFPASQPFGRHVANCARHVGFDGSHNPSEHSGAANWDVNHSCDS
jgi:hypothetical protein